MLSPVKKRPEGGTPNSVPVWTPYDSPPDRNAVTFRDQVGHDGLDIPDVAQDPGHMLTEAFPPGYPTGFVDGILGDKLIEKVQPVLADHFSEEPPGKSFVAIRVRAVACTHVVARSGGSRMPTLALSPPSTGRVTPVMYEAAGEVRNQITSACSRGCAQRCWGIRLARAAPAGPARTPSVSAVAVPPGAIALILMFSAA
jgi:hypothetical protein